MSFNKPDAPDPTATSNAQMGYNQQAATAQNKTNSYNQSTPFGSVTYVADSSSPSGYRLVTDTSATGQTLLNTAGNLANSSAGMYSTPFNGNNQAVTDKLNQWSSQYVQPIFNQQSSNLEAQLRNQGLTPGSEAYNNAQNLLARNQGDVTNQFLQQNQQQGFNQALQEYQQPLQTISGLMQAASPGTFQQTPNAQIQPANYAGAVQQNYTNEMQNYENNMAALGKLGGSVIGLAAAPFTGGTSLMSSMGGMFGGTPDYGQTSNVQVGGYSMPQFGRAGGW